MTQKDAKNYILLVRRTEREVARYRIKAERENTKLVVELRKLAAQNLTVTIYLLIQLL